MNDLPSARLLPGIPFDAKARKKRRKGEPAPASTCTPPFDEVRPFLTGTPLRGLTGRPPLPEPAPQAPLHEPATPDPDRDENLAA